MKWLLGVALLLLPAVARAQSFEIDGGFAFTGGRGAGSVAANETRNPSTGSTPLTLFQTDSRVLGAAGVDVHAGVYLTSRLLVAATFQYSRPTLRTHVSADFEGAADADADTTVSEYLFGGAFEYRLRAATWIPFVSGGAAQLRDVPDGGDVFTAAEIHAGGGVRHLLTSGRHPLGIRGEFVASYRSGGAGFDSKHHVLPSVTAGLTWRF
jgi:hypothetical protein